MSLPRTYWLTLYKTVYATVMIIANSFSKSFKSYVFNFNENTIVTILNCLPSDATEVKNICHRIILSFKIDYNLNPLALVSGNFNGYGNL